jgi:thiol-disulfide isomerase/thioredoxin
MLAADKRSINMNIRLAILTLCLHIGMSAHVRDVSTLPKHLDAFLRESSKPVIVAFYGENCSPCTRMKPQFAQFAQQNPSITCVTVNTSRHRAIGQRYTITRVPRFVYFQPHSTQSVHSHGSTDISDFARNIQRHFPTFT